MNRLKGWLRLKSLEKQENSLTEIWKYKKIILVKTNLKLILKLESWKKIN